MSLGVISSSPTIEPKYNNKKRNWKVLATMCLVHLFSAAFCACSSSFHYATLIGMSEFDGFSSYLFRNSL